MYIVDKPLSAAAIVVTKKGKYVLAETVVGKPEELIEIVGAFSKVPDGNCSASLVLYVNNVRFFEGTISGNRSDVITAIRKIVDIKEREKK